MENKGRGKKKGNGIQPICPQSRVYQKGQGGKPNPIKGPFG